MNFLDCLKNKIVFFDGGMGTLLLKNGLRQGEITESMNFTFPEVVERIHREYYLSGADCITANTFGANRIKLGSYEHSAPEVIRAALDCAKRARDSFSDSKERFIALDIASTGQMLSPVGELDFEDAYEAFRESAIAGEENGADLAIIETMIDTYEMKAAVLAVKENTNLPVIASFSYDENGKLLTGGDIEGACAMLEGLGVDVIGINCGFGPEKMKEFFLRLKKVCSLPISIMPNADLPRIENGEVFYDITPEHFASCMKEIAEGGASVIGGCCGTTPDYIRETFKLCKDIKPHEITDKGLTVVTSCSRHCTFNERSVIIGERINPTGKKILREALISGNYDYIIDKAIEQMSDGADILDVNVGLPEIDEKAVMLRVVGELQSATPLPLQIDTSDPEVMEAALRIYNGKAMINSVNGKRSVMEKIFPLAKKYGGVIVGLTLDENGIPDTAEGRFKIAEKIVKTAAEYGINKKDIIIDTLTMSVSSNSDAAKITLDALSLVKERLGVRTVLGVSNVSFGLPRRDIVNSVFFSAALKAGLDAGIINPSSDEMMNSFYAMNMINGNDENCEAFISHFSENSAAVQGDELFTAIYNGLSDSAYTVTKERLKTEKSEAIVEKSLVPALNEVGKKFEENKIFLPQLMKSAQAAQSSFAAIKESLSVSGESQKSKGKIILATVKGDIHDIGKNIVKVMLQNYGYDVIDLGKDVDCNLVLETAQKESVSLVGLSALMTTTVASMKETVRLIKENLPECSVMVGGAVLTEEYAASIHADFYAKDAMESVRFADKIFKNQIQEANQ